MKHLIRVEEAAMFGLCLFGLYYLEAEWWVYLLLFVGPDISLIGYVTGNKSAAATLYNIFHHKAIAAAIFLAGFQLNNELMEVTGLVLFGHASMDRMFGYGLKLSRGFKYTHLGIIGKK
jgi:hypothetical protein